MPALRPANQKISFNPRERILPGPEALPAPADPLQRRGVPGPRGAGVEILARFTNDKWDIVSPFRNNTWTSLPIRDRAPVV